jgi:HSP20 family protein
MRYRRIRYQYTRILSETQTDLLATPYAGSPAVPVAYARWRPAADLFEIDTAFIAHVEAAGVLEKDVEITLYTNAVIVQGLRECPDCGDARYYVAGIRHGPFRVELPLPDEIDADEATARIEHGLLVITLPKLSREER